jgi:hypothetical protein
MHAC